MTHSRPLVIAAVAFAVALAAVVGVLVIALLGPGRSSTQLPSGNGSALSRGETIFQTGRDANGVRIPRTVSQNDGMMGGGMMGDGMMGRGCASCHGTDGRGRSTAQYTAPDITYANLTDPQGMLMPDGTRDVTYTDAGIREAVTQGIDPEGDHLEWPMPQWQLSSGEWSDLLDYLKTLH